jgi:uncharacterized repeat protein (TIGR03803 family)
MRPRHTRQPILVSFVLLLASLAAHASGPQITSVTQIWARSYQTIQIVGSGFGSLHPYDGDSEFIQITDLTQNWSAGHTGDAVTLDISTWSDTLIQIDYFDGAYGTGNQSFVGGDKLLIKIWNAQTAAGPGTTDVIVLANATSIYYLYSSTSDINDTATPIVDDQGNFYSIETSNTINCPQFSCGSIYELSPASNGTYTQTILYTFTGGSQGFGPESPLVRDSAGNIYGTTANGGAGGSLCFLDLGCGVVFEVSNGVETVLHTFTGTPDGIGPAAGLVSDSAGNLFGTTAGGGANNYGTVFELSPNGSGGFNYSIIYSFQGGAAGDGAEPAAPLVLDAHNNLYGTTTFGGTTDYCDDEAHYGCGTVFELSLSSSGAYLEKILYAFHGTSNGVSPATAVVFDSSGNLYGTTYNGGPSCGYRNSAGCGVVYELTPTTHGPWQETTLCTFSEDAGNIDGGEFPRSALTYYNGQLYGFAGYGASMDGTLFSVTPEVVDSLQTIYSYGGGYDGVFPVGQPFVGPDGLLYGAAYYGIDILPTALPSASPKR